MFQRFTNSVDLEYREISGANEDLCGSQIYKIFELIGSEKVPSNLVTVDSENRRLLLSTESIDDLGLHDMVLEVYLPEFGVAHD